MTKDNFLQESILPLPRLPGRDPDSVNGAYRDRRRRYEYRSWVRGGDWLALAVAADVLWGVENALDPDGADDWVPENELFY